MEQRPIAILHQDIAVAFGAIEAFDDPRTRLDGNTHLREISKIIARTQGGLTLQFEFRPFPIGEVRVLLAILPLVDMRPECAGAFQLVLARAPTSNTGTRAPS